MSPTANRQHRKHKRGREEGGGGGGTSRSQRWEAVRATKLTKKRKGQGGDERGRWRVQEQVTKTGKRQKSSAVLDSCVRLPAVSAAPLPPPPLALLFTQHLEVNTPRRGIAAAFLLSEPLTLLFFLPLSFRRCDTSHLLAIAQISAAEWQKEEEGKPQMSRTTLTHTGKRETKRRSVRIGRSPLRSPVPFTPSTSVLVSRVRSTAVCCVRSHSSTLLPPHNVRRSEVCLTNARALHAPSNSFSKASHHVPAASARLSF